MYPATWYIRTRQEIRSAFAIGELDSAWIPELRNPEIIGVIREIQTAKPGIFGPNGGYSRAYSLTNLSWNMGLLTGPLLSGSLVQAVGYYYMNFTLGMYH